MDTLEARRDIGLEQSYIERARELVPMLREAGDEIERGREVTPEIVEAMKDRGIFRMLLPRSLGGAELDPLTYTEVLVHAGPGRRQHGLVPGAEFRLLDDRAVSARRRPRARCSATATASSPGVRTCPGPAAGSSSRAAIASPGAGASRPAAGTPNGSAATRRCSTRTAARANCRTGASRCARWCSRKSEAQIIDNWQVLGLRGTGSDSYALNDHFVPQTFTAGRDNLDELREKGPLYQFTSGMIYAMSFAHVSMGIAKGAFDAFIEIARDKVPRGAKGTLRENNVIQSQVAQCEAKLQIVARLSARRHRRDVGRGARHRRDQRRLPPAAAPRGDLGDPPVARHRRDRLSGGRRRRRFSRTTRWSAGCATSTPAPSRARAARSISRPSARS